MNNEQGIMNIEVNGRYSFNVPCSIFDIDL